MTTPIIKNNIPIANLPLQGNLQIVRELMGKNEIQVDVDLPGVLVSPIGSHIELNGKRYTVNTPPLKVEKLGDRHYNYSLMFESVLYRLYDKKLRHLGNRTFQFYGNLTSLAQLIVDNINEIDSGWTVGPCDDLPEKTIGFSGHTCRTALDTGAEAFGVEWENIDKEIRFTKSVGRTTSHVFKVGMGKGLYTLSYAYQNDKNVVTRAYGYGSTRNLPENYRGGATQLMFDGEYLEKNVDIYKEKEGDYDNSDIYPEVDGVVSTAPAWVQNAATFIITDQTLDFNLSDHFSKLTPKLSFKSGELQGQEFEIVKYVHATKTITLKTFEDSNKNTLPRTGVGAAPGDKYTLFDMFLPSERVAAAEAKLKAATEVFLNENSVPRVLYSMEMDPLYARDNNIILEPGDQVRIIDEALGIDEMIRITKTNYPFDFPERLTPSSKITVEIANFIPYTLTERIISNVIDNKNALTDALTKLDVAKKVADALATKTGVDWLPPGTMIIDPETGSISASLILTDMLIARQVKTATTGARIEIYGNTMDSYNPNNKLARRQTVEEGVVKDIWYNLNGDRVYEVGQNGIVYVNSVPQSWTPSPLRFVNVNEAPTFETLVNSINTPTNICQKSGYVGTDKSLMAYFYNAGQGGSAESNRPYEGYKNSSGSITTDNIPDGWYIAADTFFMSIDGTNDYVIEFMHVVGGKVTEGLSGTATLTSTHVCSFDADPF